MKKSTSRPAPWLPAGATVLATLPVLLALGACGGGAASAGSAPATAATNLAVAQAQLTPLFAASSGTSLPSDPSTVILKACMMPARQVGNVGQSGADFLDTLAVDILPAETAPLYNALTGKVDLYVKRAYKGSNGLVGAPPILFGGVAGQVNGNFVGFGAPCGPNAMTTAPPGTCFWMADDINGTAHAATNVISVGGARPESSTGGAVLGNLGWTAGPAFTFWYEAGPGAACSAPAASTIWKSR